MFGEAAATTKRGIGYLMSVCLQYYLAEGLGGEVPPEYAEPQGRVTVVA